MTVLVYNCKLSNSVEAADLYRRTIVIHIVIYIIILSYKQLE